ncbi:hypothetical protein [Stutzerimonas nitrititolerans]|uniref:hypothetical protein n=1 Tax=Stutzerimonas nitrititolerans TaxID=2482751 RepID=UPI0028A0932D|nr:hypothetical protein [Stutzerimonas nitrititolerans]
MASKSLGTLTLDLVAKVGGFTQGMDKASRESAKWRKQVEKDAKVIGTAVGAASAAAIAGLAAMTVSTVKAAGEVSRFAAISGAGVEEFQRYAAAADVVGISQEKLSDQLKDFNEKVGEFQQSGGGGMKDFFEQIAPQIGITADAFKGLSGPQGLQLYYNSLEKAGLSQDQMSFYLESMASDTTALIPLLREGGAGFKLMGDAAAAAGAVMSQDTIRAANELSAATTLLKMTADGASNQIMEAMLPALSDMAAELVGVSAEGETFAEVGDKIVSVLKFVARAGVGAYSAFQLAGKGLAGLAFIASEIPNGLDAISKAAGMVGDELEETASRAAAAIEAIDNAGSSGTTNPTIAAMADLLEETGRAASRAGSSITGAAKDSSDAVEKQLSALERAAAVWGMTADKVALYDLAAQGATEAQLAQAEASLAVVAGLERQAAAVKALNEAEEQTNRDALAIVDSLLSEEEQIKQSYERRRQIIMDATLLTAEERNEALLRLEQEHNEQMIEVNGSYWERYLAAAEENLQSFDELSGVMLENFTGRFGDAFESMVFDAESFGDAISGLAEGMARSVVNALGQMAAQWVAYHAVQLMLGKTSEATAVASAAVAGTSIAAAYAPAAAMASLASFGANSVPAMAGITSTVGLSQTMALAGMAHDGIDSIPATGTWLLEKGERVTTAETSAKLDKTLSDIQQGGSGAPIVNLYEDASKAGQVNSREEDGQNVIDIFVSNIMSDGKAQQAISRKFGLQGVGQ